MQRAPRRKEWLRADGKAARCLPACPGARSHSPLAFVSACFDACPVILNTNIVYQRSAECYAKRGKEIPNDYWVQQPFGELCAVPASVAAFIRAFEKCALPAPRSPEQIPSSGSSTALPGGARQTQEQGFVTWLCQAVATPPALAHPQLLTLP